MNNNKLIAEPVDLEALSTEGNKLIAEFMGVRFMPDDEYIERLKENREEGVCFDLGRMESELKYHTSWDWLIPVVEKINNCKDKHGYDYNFQIGNGYVWLDPGMGDRIYFSGNKINYRDEPMISKVYRGVMAFLKVYNEKN